MANEIDLDQLVADWFEKEDPFRAVATATAYLRSAGAAVGFDHLPLLERVVEPAWDGPGAEPRLVLDVLLAAEPAFLRAEHLAPGLDSTHRVAVRARSQLLIARAWYHAGHPRQAFATVLAILTWLSQFVDGRMRLVEALASPTPNVVAAAAVGALGLYPAALRRAGYLPQTEAGFMKRGLELVEDYLRLGRSGSPVLYERAHALGSQWFFAQVRDHPDDRLIRALYELDLATRPDDARSHATEALRDFEFARRFGDTEAERRHRAEAIPNLRLFPLERHERAIAAQGYLAA